MYKIIIRPLLFLFEPETIHSIIFSILKISSYIPFNRIIMKTIFSYRHPILEREVFGIKFPNPVGLASGLDKDAEVFDNLGYMGFGFIEIGTVTPVAQPGNEKPRCFRLKSDSALINRMGFNNKGVKYTIEKLKKKKSGIIVGGNIGKNKITPNENAIDDYLLCINELYPYVDYFTVNVSSPNTPNLRELQEKEPLKKILSALVKVLNEKEKYKPVLLKIAPDLTNRQLDDIIEIALETKIDGIIATNTTIGREGLNHTVEEIEKIGNGGLSGKPLRNKSTEVIRYISEKSDKKIPIIGVGGIFDADDAIEKLEAGASLIQLYTGFIYEGPEVVKRINKSLVKYFLKV